MYEWAYLFVSHDDPPAVDVAVVVRVAFALHFDVELDHSPCVFSALVCFALLAHAKGHACHRRDGGEGQESDDHDGVLCRCSVGEGLMVRNALGLWHMHLRQKLEMSAHEHLVARLRRRLEIKSRPTSLPHVRGVDNNLVILDLDRGQ